MVAVVFNVHCYLSLSVAAWMNRLPHSQKPAAKNEEYISIWLPADFPVVELINDSSLLPIVVCGEALHIVSHLKKRNGSSSLTRVDTLFYSRSGYCYLPPLFLWLPSQRQIRNGRVPIIFVYLTQKIMRARAIISWWLCLLKSNISMSKRFHDAFIPCGRVWMRDKFKVANRQLLLKHV